MSQNNSNDTGMGIGLAFGILAVMAYVFFAVLAFITFILTILCLAAWNTPITIGTWTLTPIEARSFVRRGAFGAMAVPLFCVFVELFFKVSINWDALPLLVGGGYVGGSLGVEWLLAQEAEAQGTLQIQHPQLPTLQEVQPPRKALPPKRQPYEFGRPRPWRV